MREIISEKFNSFVAGKIVSWRWLRSDFAEFFHKEEQNKGFSEKGPHRLIWSTGSKFVLLVKRGDDSPRVVFKSFRRIRRKIRWFLRFSPNTAEAVNYAILAEHGFPVAELLAVGDERKFGILQKTFLVTEFCEGFSDGREFLPGGKYENAPDLLDKFASKNFRLLAKLHDLNLLHKGFTPANLLFKALPDDELEVKWIDVAGCKKLPDKQMKKLVPYDFVSFFRYFDFSADERRKYCQIYLDNSVNSPFDLETLSGEVEKMFVRRGRKNAPPIVKID